MENTLPSDTKIRALSWKNPFADLMLNGKIETRTWNTDYRGLVLICVSKTGYNRTEVFNISGPLQFSRLLETIEYKKWSEKQGFAIAVGELVDCRKMTKEDENLAFVEFYPDLYCHIYKNVRPIKPIPWKGTQGWKTLSQEDISKIEFI